MGFFERRRRAKARRRFLTNEDTIAASKLAESPLSAAAPSIADAIGDLHKVVTVSAFDAVSAAHEALAPVCEEMIGNIRKDFERRHQEQAETIRDLATRCRDEVERSQLQLSDQTAEMQKLRTHLDAIQDRSQRFEKGYDWQIIREFAFRLIGVLDQLDDRLTDLRDDAGATTAHLEDIERTYEGILHTLAASGVQQVRPQSNTSYASTERVAEKCADVRTDCPDNHGLIAQVRRPGYLFTRSGHDDVVLRRAEVSVFHSTDLNQAPELLES